MLDGSPLASMRTPKQTHHDPMTQQMEQPLGLRLWWKILGNQRTSDWSKLNISREKFPAMSFGMRNGRSNPDVNPLALQEKTPGMSCRGGGHINYVPEKPYFASSELWLATCFQEPFCRTNVSVDRIVRARGSPWYIES